MQSRNQRCRSWNNRTGSWRTKIQEFDSSTADNGAQDELLAKLPRGDNSEQLIVDLQTIGTMTNARLKDIGFALEDNNPAQAMTSSSEAAFPAVKKTVKMDALVEGTYSNVLSWMNALQLLPRIINVDSFSFQHSSNSKKI
ncbi:type 4a pilus biogenesis protein PilO [Paenibacillus rhizoplanae]